MLWDLNEGKHLYSLEAGDTINALVFSPNRYWLCAATDSAVKIFDLESKSIVDELKPEFETTQGGRAPIATSLAWSADGQTLFAGFVVALLLRLDLGADLLRRLPVTRTTLRACIRLLRNFVGHGDETGCLLSSDGAAAFGSQRTSASAPRSGLCVWSATLDVG